MDSKEDDDSDEENMAAIDMYDTHKHVFSGNKALTQMIETYREQRQHNVAATKRSILWNILSKLGDTYYLNPENDLHDTYRCIDCVWVSMVERILYKDE